MTLHVPDRLVDLFGRGQPTHTLRGINISSRSGLTYCEIALGTSGRQKTWYPAALYRATIDDPAYRAERWAIVGEVKPTVQYRGQFKVYAVKWFNPGRPLEARLTLNDDAQAFAFMQHILEAWYVRS
jgi:hypothetical protein